MSPIAEERRRDACFFFCPMPNDRGGEWRCPSLGHMAEGGQGKLFRVPNAFRGVGVLFECIYCEGEKLQGAFLVAQWYHPQNGFEPLLHACPFVSSVQENKRMPTSCVYTEFDRPLQWRNAPGYH